MTRMCRGITVIAAAMLCAAAPTAAQELQAGTWTGLLTPPAREGLAPPAGVPVTYTVTQSAGALSIVMHNIQLGDIPFSEPRLAGDQLTFWFEPGTRVDCTLQRQADRSFEGACAAGNGNGAIQMVPPVS